MTKHDDVPYLKHILDAISDIETTIGRKSKNDFLKDKNLKDATVRRLEIIGEAAKNISSAIKTRHQEIEWKRLTGTRDIMIHAYFRVDLDIVWGIVKKDIPKLKEQILSLYDSVVKA